MHRENLIIYLLLCCGFAGCQHTLEPSQPIEIFLEGEQIPGTEIFFPLGQLLPIGEYTPKFSPEGDRIIFSVPPNNEGIAPGLVVLNLRTQERRLLVPDGGNFLPDWSPDGVWIAFNRFAQIYKIKVNGDSLTQLTSIGRNFLPDWSPNGTRIAFDTSIEDERGPQGMWLMREDGTDQKWLSTGRAPDWHSSASKIIGMVTVGSLDPWNDFLVYDFAEDLTTRLHLTMRNFNDFPEYSPDGARIVFWNEEGIWVMNADGSEPKRILPFRIQSASCNGEEGLAVFSPSWHPDGKHIIYEHYRVTRTVQGIDGPDIEGFVSFYVVNVDSVLAVSNL